MLHLENAGSKVPETLPDLRIYPYHPGGFPAGRRHMQHGKAFNQLLRRDVPGCNTLHRQENMFRFVYLFNFHSCQALVGGMAVAKKREPFTAVKP